MAWRKNFTRIFTYDTVAFVEKSINVLNIRRCRGYAGKIKNTVSKTFC